MGECGPLGPDPGDVHAGRGRQFSVSGFPAVKLLKIDLQSEGFPVQILQRPRDPHRMKLIAEVASDLTADGRPGESQKVDADTRIPAVNGLDQAEVSQLAEVLGVQAAVVVM